MHLASSWNNQRKDVSPNNLKHSSHTIKLGVQLTKWNNISKNTLFKREVDLKLKCANYHVFAQKFFTFLQVGFRI